MKTATADKRQEASGSGVRAKESERQGQATSVGNAKKKKNLEGCIGGKAGKQEADSTSRHTGMQVSKQARQ